jgi:mannitol-1-/sugar-/sorbitol-6-phosphatase
VAPALDLTATAVVCDMDGTLVDSTAVVEQIWAEFADQYGADLDEVLRYSHGRLTSDSVRYFLPPGHDPVAVTAHLDAQELGRVDGIVEVPGAGAFVFSVRGAPFAVVTSASRELARRRMRVAGVLVPEVLVAAEDVAVGKPSPEGYLRAAALLGVDPGDCVIFEDAEAGLQAAVASGGQVVVVGGHESATTDGLPGIADFTGLSVSRPDGRIRLQHP